MPIWWHCDKVRDFGEQIHAIMQCIIGRRFPCTPRVMLWGDVADSLIGTSKILLINMLATATTLIASKWEMAEVPTLSD